MHAVMTQLTSENAHDVGYRLIDQVNSAWPSLRGRRNKYQPKGGDALHGPCALRLGSKGRHGSCVGGRCKRYTRAIIIIIIIYFAQQYKTTVTNINSQRA